MSECNNCGTDVYADLLIFGNHFCEVGGKRISPVEMNIKVKRDQLESEREGDEG